jgi:hypothetical protein
MLKLDPMKMVPGKKYFIKSILCNTFRLNIAVRFCQYHTKHEWDYLTQSTIRIISADFIVPASSRGSAFPWTVRMDYIRECYAIAGSCPLQRDIQLGLLGSLPNGKTIPYDVARLIASYV